MRVLITGSTGFVGQHALRQFDAVSLEGPGGAFVDLLDRPALRARLAELTFDAVLHLAAQSSVAQSFQQPEQTRAVNVQGTEALLQALAAQHFRGRFLYVSSADVYGDVPPERLPIRETQPCAPRNPYAQSKLEAEALCLDWHRRGAAEIVIVRPFNNVGPGQDQRFVLPSMARRIQGLRAGSVQPPLLLGDLEVTRDFVDVRDVVTAYRLLLEGGGTPGEVYNLCSGQERRLRAVLDELFELAGVQAQVTLDPALQRAGEQRRACGDAGKLRRATGWQPAIPWRQTLQDLLDDAAHLA